MSTISALATHSQRFQGGAKLGRSNSRLIRSHTMAAEKRVTFIESNTVTTKTPVRSTRSLARRGSVRTAGFNRPPKTGQVKRAGAIRRGHRRVMSNHKDARDLFDFYDIPEEEEEEKGDALRHVLDTLADEKGVISTEVKVPDALMFMTCLSANKDGSQVAVGSGSKSQNLFIYAPMASSGPNPPTMVHKQTLSMPSPVYALDWAPSAVPRREGMEHPLLVGSKGGMVHLVGVRAGESGRIIRRFNHNAHVEIPASASSRITSLGFMPTDDQTFFSLYHSHMFLWDVKQSSQPIAHGGLSANALTCAAGSPLTRGLVAVGGTSVGQGGIKIIDTRADWRHATGLSSAHDGPVRSVAWSPFVDNWLATGGDDGVVRVWDTRNLKETEPVTCMAGQSSGISWSMKTRTALTTASADRIVRTWDFSESLVSSASRTQQPSPFEQSEAYVWLPEHARRAALKRKALFYDLHGLEQPGDGNLDGAHQKVSQGCKSAIAGLTSLYHSSEGEAYLSLDTMGTLSYNVMN
ncbi:hypothetical protein YB2330_000931 [Saitoella coloradoensis]